MCLGIPMRVVTSDSGGAIVRRQSGEERLVSLMLVGPQPPGTPLLIHIDTALRVLSEDEVPLIENALAAIEAAGAGAPFEHLVQDLVDRTPELPPHLRPGGTS